MNLYLFTTSFPFQKGEQYIANELPFLVSKFEKVYLIPVDVTGEARSIPDNCEVINLHKKINWSFFNKTKYAFNALSLIKFGNESLSTPISKKELFKTAYNAAAYNKTLLEVIEEKNDQNAVFYSYWFYHWAFIIALIKKQNSSFKCVSRAHMGDIYDEIKQTPFKQFKLKYLTQIFPISEHASNHLKNILDKGNITKQYLGVKKQGSNPIEKKTTTFRIVTCSSIRKAKRIDFIAKVLAKCTSEIEWIHFGDGPNKNDVAKQIEKLPPNIKATLKGFVKNEDVLNYYQTNHIDLFINLSSQEGLPVSLMEAISFGIPVMGTNVYGTPEIVTNKTGILVELTENESSIAVKIDNFLNHLTINQKEIQEFWDDNFNSEVNYAKFADKLTQL